MAAKTESEGLTFMVLGNFSYYSPFYRYGSVIGETRDLDDADVLVFTGGEDVDPAMYGENRTLKCGMANKSRDGKEKALFYEALGKGIPMLGICRGAQLLNVLNGGKLVQHVDGHNSGIRHDMKLPTDTKFKSRSFYVNSTHHQLMIPDVNKDHKLLGYTKGIISHMEGVPLPEFSDYSAKYGDGSLNIKEPEVLWYKRTRSLCVQYHPERMGEQEMGKKYFDHLIEEYLL